MSKDKELLSKGRYALLSHQLLIFISKMKPLCLGVDVKNEGEFGSFDNWLLNIEWPLNWWSLRSVIYCTHIFTHLQIFDNWLLNIEWPLNWWSLRSVIYCTHIFTHLQIFNESSHERNEMLRFSDVARNSLWRINGSAICSILMHWEYRSYGRQYI